MKKHKSCTAIRELGVTLLLLLCLCVGHAFGGQSVGTVTHLSGALAAKKLDGSTRALAINSAVEEGDTLITEKRTYARIKFIDGGDVTLRPSTIFKVERYAYDEKAPEGDSAVLILVKGGLRSVSGKIGKRGNPDAYKMKTAVSTIGIRGTDWGALFCQNDCGGVPTASGQTPSNGLHLDVSSGQIAVTNLAGQQQISTGQFGFVAGQNTPPVVVPPQQGIQVTMPPSMLQNQGGGGGAQNNGGTACVVR